jgi:hypothetical protein
MAPLPGLDAFGWCRGLPLPSVQDPGLLGLRGRKGLQDEIGRLMRNIRLRHELARLLQYLLPTLQNQVCLWLVRY